MTTLYWVLEYGKVFFAYMFIMFIWPNVVFRKYLKGKKIFFNFAFCSTIQIVIVNTLVLMLGLFHILRPWVFFIIFYGIFFFFLFRNLKIQDSTKKKFKYFFTGTYGLKTLLKDIRVFIVKQIKRIRNAFLTVMHGHWWEYGILAVVVIYGMIYFTYGAFQDYSYGFGDMYPHNAWTYGLVNGQIFSAGVYPEAMHCFIYAMHMLFGIRIYSCLLFAAGIHISVFLLSAYIFFRQIFRWKYTAMVALTLFLTVDVMCINAVYSMSRLQWSIPQDFGLYTQFICAAFLARYLYSERSKKKAKDAKSISKAGRNRRKEEAALLKQKEKEKALALKDKQKEEAALLKQNSSKEATLALKQKEKEEALALKQKQKEEAALNKQRRKEDKINARLKAKEEAAVLKVQAAEEKELLKKQKKEEQLRIKVEKAEQKKQLAKNGGFSMPEGRIAYPQSQSGENHFFETESAMPDGTMPVILSDEESVGVVVDNIEPEKSNIPEGMIPEGFVMTGGVVSLSADNEAKEENTETLPLAYADAEIVESEQNPIYPAEDVQYEANYVEGEEKTQTVSTDNEKAVENDSNVFGSDEEYIAYLNSTDESTEEKSDENVITKLKKFWCKVKSNWAFKILERVWKDENLLVFTSALAASLVIHFYPTIMAFFLCLAFVPLAVHKVFKPRRFIELVVAVIVGLIVAVTPMAGALASGIQFQGSIGWAVSIIEGEDPEATTTVDENATTEEDETSSEDMTGNLDSTTDSTEDFTGEDASSDNSINGTNDGSEDSSFIPGGIENLTNTGDINSEGQSANSLGKKISSLMSKAEYVITHLDEIILEKADIVYHRAYVELYRRERAEEIIISTGIAFATWAVLKVLSVIASLIGRVKKKRISMIYFDGYFALILCSVFFMMLYSAGALGLPSLIAGSRLCSVAQLLIVAVMVIPVDAIFTGISVIIKKGLMNVVGLLAVVGTYLMVYYSGNFHGYLYYELTRHNAAVMCTYSITESLPKNSYTIVSPVDELYQVIQYGYHEELVEFINSSTEKSYKIPSEYVFIFVEKKPIQYAQSHFFEGPDWLAHEKYADYYNSYVSQCPDITTSDISDKIAELPFSKLPVSSDMYSNLETRTVLESRCYAWCREFNKMYPNELKVYYEDDNFVCYYFRQNPFSLFELAIQHSI